MDTSAGAVAFHDGEDGILRACSSKEVKDVIENKKFAYVKPSAGTSPTSSARDNNEHHKVLHRYVCDHTLLDCEEYASQRALKQLKDGLKKISKNLNIKFKQKTRTQLDKAVNQLLPVFKKTFTPDFAHQGFKKTGIYPPNTDAILQLSTYWKDRDATSQDFENCRACVAAETEDAK